MQTIAEDKRIWKATNGKPEQDYLMLLETLFASARKSGYGLEFRPIDYSQTTFHELKVPLTINEAREIYLKEGRKAINPAFIDLLKKVDDYNRFCEAEESFESRIRKMQVTDFMNFMYLAEEVLQSAPYHESTVTKGFFKKRTIQKNDKNPIVILTNSEKDGLVEILKPTLIKTGVNKNRAIRVINLGLTSESLAEFYSRSGIEDIQGVNAYLTGKADCEFGIFTNERSIFGKFSGETDLLGIENKIDAVLMNRWNLEHSSWIMCFERLKSPQ